jgi:hypothetical protein
MAAGWRDDTHPGFLLNRELPPRIEPFAKETWDGFAPHVRTTVLVVVCVVALIPALVGFLVSMVCPICTRDRDEVVAVAQEAAAAERDGTAASGASADGARESAGTGARAVGPRGRTLPCLGTCPVKPDGQPESGFFIGSWVVLYLRLGLVAARLAILFASHIHRFPRSKPGAADAPRAASAFTPAWVAPEHKSWWKRSTFYLITVGSTFLLHLFANYMWVVLYGCRRSAKMGRTALLLSLSSALSLAFLLIPIDGYSAATLGAYVAYLVFALILNEDSIENEEEIRAAAA